MCDPCGDRVALPCRRTFARFPVAEVEQPKKLAPVVDLMAALKASLVQMEGRKKPAAPAEAAPAKRAKR